MDRCPLSTPLSTGHGLRSLIPYEFTYFSLIISRINKSGKAPLPRGIPVTRYDGLLLTRMMRQQKAPRGKDGSLSSNRSTVHRSRSSFTDTIRVHLLFPHFYLTVILPPCQYRFRQSCLANFDRPPLSPTTGERPPPSVRSPSSPQTKDPAIRHWMEGASPKPFALQFTLFRAAHDIAPARELTPSLL